MTEHAPDLAGLFDGHVLGAESDRLARVHDALVQAGPLPALPDTLAQPPAVARPAP